MSYGIQIVYLFILAIPVACIAWTVTHEEVFREPRDYCAMRSKKASHIWSRKFFYLFTCEYCFSHYVVILMLVMTNYKLLFADWRGYIIAGFAMVWIANIYMSLFGLVRQDIKMVKTGADLQEKQLKQDEDGIEKERGVRRMH